ncbi:MAG: Sugar phosphatase YidA [Firmicutes bacterium ADurb.Bin182]|nr:MAG: Sugar phosphatase YidA [Firmicutes bacterium ADurb.Bin182]
MKYKILAMDIDDTLLSGTSEISACNMQAIRKAQEAGVFVTIATGRNPLGSQNIWKALNIKGPIINFGGAMITDTRTGKILHTTSIENEQVQEILEMAVSLSLHAQIYQGSGIVYERENAVAISYAEALKIPHTVDPDIRKKKWDNVPKVLMFAEPGRVEKLIPELQKHFDGRIKVSASKPTFIEFNHISSNKGTALAKLCEIMDVRRDETAAIGDNTLDEEMIEWAGLGAAVGNAQPRIKAIADVITPGCDDDGVAWLINNCLLGGTE